MLFLIGLTISIGLMTPGLYHSFMAKGLTDAIGATLLMFWLSLLKRRTEKKHIQFLKKQKQSLEAKTFGNFTLMYENKVVKFSRTKSDELLGYLIYKKGSSVKTKELISILWVSMQIRPVTAAVFEILLLTSSILLESCRFKTFLLQNIITSELIRKL